MIAIFSSLTHARVPGRDAFLAENAGSLAWTIGKLLYAIVFKLQQKDVLEKVDSIECPVSLECYINEPTAVFASLHPCAHRVFSAKHACTDGGRVLGPSGMHYVSTSSVQDLYEDADKKRMEPICPICGASILFATPVGRLRHAPTCAPTVVSSQR